MQHVQEAWHHMRSFPGETALDASQIMPWAFLGLQTTLMNECSAAMFRKCGMSALHLRMGAVDEGLLLQALPAYGVNE